MGKVCRSCGGNYQARANSSRYCSPACAARGKSDREQQRRDLARKEKEAADRKRERDFASRVMRLYGITMRERQALIDAQGGHCKLCPAVDSPDARLCIDHDHGEPDKRAAVRAMVCRGCNVKIGRIERYLDLPRPFPRVIVGP